MKKRRLHLDKELVTVSEPSIDGGKIITGAAACWWLSFTYELSKDFCEDITLSGCFTDNCGSADCEPDMSDGAACGDTITCQPYSAC